MGNKHPEEEITAPKLTGLSYDHFQHDEAEEAPHQEHIMHEHFVEGPVTVLQMVTPLSPQSEPLPGETYCNVTLEGEAFRLIPVAMLPVEVATEEL